MTITAAQKSAALAAVADLATLKPQISATITSLAGIPNGDPPYRVIFIDGAENQIPPASIRARLDAIAAVLPAITTALTETTPVG